MFLYDYFRIFITLKLLSTENELLQSVFQYHYQFQVCSLHRPMIRQHYCNPPCIIRTFISQNQILKYRCELYTDTLFRNFFALPNVFSLSIFKCHIADIHQYRLYHLMHTYNHCKVIISKKYSNYCIYASALLYCKLQSNGFLRLPQSHCVCLVLNCTGKFF